MIRSCKACASTVTESLLSEASGRRFAGDNGMYGANDGDSGSNGGVTGRKMDFYIV
jgi:hypothetical protein